MGPDAPGVGGPPSGWLPGTAAGKHRYSFQPLLLDSSNSCLPGKQFHSFKALSVGALPTSCAFNTERQRILKVTFHFPRAQSHEVDFFPFVVYLEQPCPVGVLVCVLTSGDCGYWTLPEAGKHSFASWDSAQFGLCTLPSNNTLDNLGPLPAYPVYTHASEQCTWQC